MAGKANPTGWIRVPNGGTPEQPTVYTAIREALQESADSIRTLQSQVDGLKPSTGAAGTATQIFVSDGGSGGGSGGGGSVTSVDLALSTEANNFLSVSGGPIVTAGTITLGLDTQVKNKVFAGPATGVDAIPTFRLLDAADIPDISATYLTVTTAASTYLTQANAATTYVALAGSYSDPPWITSLAGSKISGNISGNAANVTGIVALANGGTNKNLTASNGGIVYTDADSMEVLAATATAGQILRSGSNAAPSWSTATYPATTTANQLLYSSAANTIGGLTSANSSVLVTNGTGVPSFATDIPTAVTIGGSYIYRASGTDVAIADGGTGASTKTAAFDALSPLTTLGEIIYHDGTDNVRLAGNTTTTRKFLRQVGDATNSAAPAWDTLAAGDIPSLSSVYLPLAGGTMSGAINMGAYDITNAGLIALKGARSYTSGGGGAGTNGYYAPVVTLDLTTQFATATLTLAVAVNGNSGASSEMDSAIVQLRFKQQAAMASASIVDVEVLSATSDSWDTDSFIFIQTANTVSNSTGTLYVELINNFCNLTATVIDYFLSTSGSSYTICTASTSPSNAIVAPGSLPAGTQTKAAGFFVAGSGVLKMYAGSAERARITTAGRVGVGTTVPQVLMHLDGTGATLDGDLYNNTDTLLMVQNSGTGVRMVSATSDATNPLNIPTLVWLTAKGTVDTPTAIASGDYLGRLLVQGISTGGGRYPAAELRTAVDAAPGATYVPGRFEFHTTNSSGTSAERMRIDNAGNVTIDTNTFFVDATNNRVGIGTASPSYPFHVASTITSASGTVLSYSSATIAPSSSPATGSYFGQYSLIQSSGANSTGTLTAVYGEAYNSGSSTLTWLRGVSAAVGIGVSATGNVTSAAAFYAFSPVQLGGATGTYTTAYAAYLGAQTVTGVTKGYGVYAPGTSDLNTLAGKLRIGSATDPTNALDVTGTATVSTKVLVGTTTADTNSLVMTRSDTNGSTGITAYNQDAASSAALSYISASDGSTSVSLYSLGAGYTTSGALQVSSGVLWVSKANGLNIVANNASTGLVRAYAGGSAAANERVRVALTKSLNDAVATTVISLTLGTNTYSGCSILYTIEANDASNYQAKTGIVHVAAVRAAGSGVTQISDSVTTAAVTTGTLTSTWTATYNAGTGAVDVQLNADTSLTPTTLRVRYVVFNNGSNAFT